MDSHLEELHRALDLHLDEEFQRALDVKSHLEELHRALFVILYKAIYLIILGASLVVLFVWLSGALDVAPEKVRPGLLQTVSAGRWFLLIVGGILIIDAILDLRRYGRARRSLALIGAALQVLEARWLRLEELEAIRRVAAGPPAAPPSR